MSGNSGRARTSTTWRRGVIVSVSAPVLGPLFATLTSLRSAWSHGLLRTLRDGTDPLLGGHDDAPADHHMASVRPGGTA